MRNDKHSPYMLVTCNVGLHLPVSRKYALTPPVMKCRTFYHSKFVQKASYFILFKKSMCACKNQLVLNISNK